MSISVETLALAKKNTKQAVEEAVTSVYRYKGSVETFEDLPTSGQKVGDVYNVEKEAGRNYAWDGSDWDALGIAENLGDIEFTGADSEIKTINEDFWDKDKVQEELDDVSNNLSNTSNALNNSINEVSNVANAAYESASNANNALGDLGNIEFFSPVTITKDLTYDKTSTSGVPIRAREVKDGKITIKVTNNQDMPTIQYPDAFTGGYGPTPQQSTGGPCGGYTPSISSNVNEYIFTIKDFVIQNDYYIFIQNEVRNMGSSTGFFFQGTLSYERETAETHTINNDYYDKDDVDNLVSNISNELSNTSNTLSNNINSVSNIAANAYNAANAANSQATSAYNATNALSNTTNETFANLGNVEFNDKKIISYYPDARNIMFDVNDFNNDDIIELHIDIQEASNYLSNHPECNGKLYMALFASNSTNNFENYAGQSTAGADAYFKIDLTTGVRTIPISWIKNAIKQRYFIIGSRVEYVKTSSPFKMAFTEHYLTDNSYLVYPSYSKRSIYDSYYNKIETEELVNNSKIDIGNSDFISTLTNIKDYNIETLEDNKIFIEVSSNMNNVNRFLWVNTSIPVIYDNIQKQQSTEEEEWTIGTLTIDNFNEINTFIEESDYYNGFTMSIGYTYNQKHIGITDRFTFVQLYPNTDEQNFEIKFNKTLDEYITNYDVYFISFSDMICIRKSNKAYWKYLQNPVYHFQYAEPVKHTINQDYYDKDATNSLTNDTLNAAKAYTDSKFDISLKKEVVQTLPVEGEDNILYLVPKQDSSNDDIYDEYIWDDKWEKIGSTATDLSGYYTSNEVDNIITNVNGDITNAANQASCAISIANSADNVAAMASNKANVAANAVNDLANVEFNGFKKGIETVEHALTSSYRTTTSDLHDKCTIGVKLEDIAVSEVDEYDNEYKYMYLTYDCTSDTFDNMEIGDSEWLMLIDGPSKYEIYSHDDSLEYTKIGDKQIRVNLYAYNDYTALFLEDNNGNDLFSDFSKVTWSWQQRSNDVQPATVTLYEDYLSKDQTEVFVSVIKNTATCAYNMANSQQYQINSLEYDTNQGFWEVDKKFGNIGTVAFSDEDKSFASNEKITASSTNYFKGIDKVTLNANNYKVIVDYATNLGVNSFRIESGIACGNSATNVSSYRSFCDLTRINGTNSYICDVSEAKRLFEDHDCDYCFVNAKRFSYEPTTIHYNKTSTIYDDYAKKTYIDDISNALSNDISNVNNQATCAEGLARSAESVAQNANSNAANATNLAQAAYDAANSLAPAAWQEISNVTTNEATNSVTLPIDKEYDEYLITFNRPFKHDGPDVSNAFSNENPVFYAYLGNTNLQTDLSIYPTLESYYKIEHVIQDEYIVTGVSRNNLKGSPQKDFKEELTTINDITNSGVVFNTLNGSIEEGITMTVYGKGEQETE